MLKQFTHIFPLMGLAILLILFQPFFSSAQTSFWAEEMPVRKVQLLGVKKISKNKIRQQITELWPPPLWKFWQENPKFTPDKLEADLKRVQQFYRQQGYYQTMIKPKIAPQNGLLLITLDIKEGPPVSIEKVNFKIRDAETAKWEKQFRRLIGLQAGKIFRIKDYEQAKTDILEYLANSGYPRARLFGKVLIYKKENKATINLLIELGPFTRFGRVQVKGNKNISLSNILREVSFVEGEIFSMKKIFQSQTKIYKSGFFRSVLVNPVGLQEQESGPVNVQIMVKERKPRTVEAGVGYGSEDKLRLRLTGTYRNIFGGARELKLSLNFSALTEEEALSFTQPYFPDQSSTSRWTLSRRKDNFSSFDLITASSEFRIDKKITPTLSTFLAYRLDSSKISALSKTAQKDQEKVYFLSYFQTGLKRDTTDSPLNPTSGAIATLFVEPSLQAIGSNVSYVKGTIEYKRYYHLLEGPILAGRVLMGTIQPFGLNQRKVPIMKRFFSGGSLSVRGYGYQKLGPRGEDGKAVGGNALFEGNTEIRFPVIGQLWGVCFLDFGNVFLNSEQFNFDDLRYSVGTGIRYNTIIGPLRLDLGYVLNPENKERYRLHFSIGQAF